MTRCRASLVAWLSNLVVVGACLMGASACSGSSSPPAAPSPPTQPAPTIQYVSVTGSFLIGAVGGTTQLRANANTASGSQDVTGQATWQSSNDSIASVSSGGLVTARSAGLVVITASYQSLSGPAGISVATPVDMTGTWRGSSVNPASDITFVLAQTGDSVTGTSTVLGGGATYNGAVSGTVNGGTLIIGGSVTGPTGSLYSRWTDERCALESANTLRCVNPMTDAAGVFTLLQVTFTR